MSRSDVQVNVRLPAELVERIKRESSENRRSMTAEIVFQLTKAYQRPAGNEEEAS